MAKGNVLTLAVILSASAIGMDALGSMIEEEYLIDVG